ncbi:BatD family protein, partial [candidate division FCPU426 bacterium]|nr:BatD family protein [candidate division FCPU426 bacterium]
VNEPLVLHFRFFSRIPILSQPQYQPADTSGFWAEDLPPQREYTTRLNGQEYRVIEIRQVLFPTTSGDLTIGPAHLIVQVQDFQHRMRDPFADSFFRDFFSSGQRVTLQSKPIGVHVKPIPDSGRPPDFTGTVGSWSLSARLDRNEAKVGEAVTLEIRIFGEGNVKSVGKPQLPPLTGFKVYETVSSSEVQKKEDAIQGVKIYRTLLRPEVSGTLSIPPIAYSYFNPRAGKFERVQVPSLALRVLPGDQDVSALAALAP